jgi:hypothetical protein
MRFCGCSALFLSVALLHQSEQVGKHGLDESDFIRCRNIGIIAQVTQDFDLAYSVHSSRHPLPCCLGLPIPVLAMNFKQGLQFR